MTTAPDLSKLRINRDALPQPVRRAFKRNVILAAIALGLVVTVAIVVRRGGAVPVQVDAVVGPAS